jgi:hypothetical protein
MLSPVMIFVVQGKLSTSAVTLRGRTPAEVDAAVEMLVNIPMGPRLTKCLIILTIHKTDLADEHKNTKDCSLK